MLGSRSPGPWTRWARLYRLQLPFERPSLRALLAMLEVGGSDSVLDLGTGTAALLRELSRLPQPPRSAIGVDRSPEMLARAPALPPGWRLLEADAAELPFPDASFDLVTSAYLLHLLEPEARTQTIAEARRVLAPGGRLGVVTVAPPAGGLPSLFWRPLQALAAGSAGPLGGLRPLDPREELAAAGFRAIRVHRVGAGYPSLCVTAEAP